MIPVPINSERWLICGGRDFADQSMFDDAMSSIMQLRGCPSCVIHGGALGADHMAERWAERMAVNCIPVRADWALHGKGAGPIRNQKMLEKYSPNAVIAFPGGKGTADMVVRAHSWRDKGNSLDVIEIRPTAPPPTSPKE